MLAAEIARIDGARRLDRLIEAEELGREVLVAHPGSDAARVALGRVLLATGDDAGALELFKAAAEDGDDNATGWSVAALSRLHRHAEAESLARTAITSDPHAVYTVIALARCLEDQGRAEEGLTELQRLHDTQPDWPRVAQWLAIAWSWIDRHDESAAVARRLVERHPAFGPGFLVLGQALAELGDIEEAECSLRTAAQCLPDDLRCVVARLEALRAAGRLQDARTAGADAAGRFDSSARVHRAVARVLLDLEEYDEALGLYERALELNPADQEALEWRTTALRYSERHAEAAEAARAAVAAHRGSIRLALEEAWALDALGRPQEALEYADAVLRRHSRHVWALQSRIAFLQYVHRYAEAGEAAWAALQLWPRSPDVLVSTGWALSALDRDAEAIELCERALTVNPRHSGALRGRVDFLGNARRYDDALAAAQEAVEQRPHDPDVLVSTGWALSALDRDAEAIELCERALTVNPRHSGALRGRVHFLRNAYQYDALEKVAQEAEERRPHDPDVLISAAWALSAFDRAAEAADLCDRALAVDPDNASVLASRIDVLRTVNRHAEAERAVQDALERRPGSPDVLMSAAWALSVRDRDVEAAGLCDRVLAVDAGHGLALRSRMDFLRYASRYADAERAMREALERRPGDPDVWVSAAWVLSALDRDGEAVEHCDRALAIDASHSWALRSRVTFLRYAHRYAEAEAASLTARERRPLDPWVQLTHGWLLDDLERPDDAARQFEVALGLDSRSEYAMQWLISSLAEARRFTEAESVAIDAISRRHRSPDVLVAAAWLFNAVDRVDEGIAMCDRALAIDERHSWALRSRIGLYRCSCRIPEALTAAAEAIARRPDDPDVRVEAAWLCSETGEHARALAECQRALQIDPRNGDAQQWAGAALRFAHRLDEAEAHLRGALVANPASVQLWVELGRTFDDRLAYDEALSCFGQALTLRPHDNEALIARSATLRSLRRWMETEADVTAAVGTYGHDLNLRLELAWLHLDRHLLDPAHDAFSRIEQDATTRVDLAAAKYGLGWTCFGLGEFGIAEAHFRRICEWQPHNDEYRLALAWSLVRQPTTAHLAEAHKIAEGITDTRHVATAAVCLGVIAFQRGMLASAEHYFLSSIRLDPFHGSHTDLGALYIQMGRYDAAERELKKALDRDQHDVQAHVELGELYLQRGGDRVPDAEQHFRQALAIEPASGDAALGLAETKSRRGDRPAAEAELRKALRRQDIDQRWLLHLELARLLIERGEHDVQICGDGYTQAKQAIERAPDDEADPHFLAGVALYRVGALVRDVRNSASYRRRAMRHFGQALKRDDTHVEARRNLLLLQQEIRTDLPVIWGGLVVGMVAIILLAASWIAFFVSDKVTTVLLSTTTPLLIGLLIVAVVLPSLIRLKLPGFEAHLDVGARGISSGPTGDVTLKPGRLNVGGKPTGQIPRRGHHPIRLSA